MSEGIVNSVVQGNIATVTVNHPPVNALNEGIMVSLREALNIEAEHFGILCGTDDKNEGVDAFLNKRKPTYKGK